MNDRPAAAGRDALRKVAKVAPGSTRRELTALRERVAELEEDLQEARRLNVRVAELLDLVEELLVPMAQQDEERVQRYLDAHTAVL
ncbi:MAG: hypothetical protein QM714_17950 [Nocardioides sp.]|uniref:DUF6752 domain-containing protein n=1 Tax=Nocardioides sp. TaxID=35761 RepID=UPI0039E669C5